MRREGQRAADQRRREIAELARRLEGNLADLVDLFSVEVGALRETVGAGMGPAQCSRAAADIERLAKTAQKLRELVSAAKERRRPDAGRTLLDLMREYDAEEGKTEAGSRPEPPPLGSGREAAR